jgi:hypothetical protein
MQSSGARQTNAQIIEQKRKIEHVGAMIEDAQDSVTQLDILHSGLDEDLVKLQSFLGDQALFLCQTLLVAPYYDRWTPVGPDGSLLCMATRNN